MVALKRLAMIFACVIFTGAQARTLPTYPEIMNHTLNHPMNHTGQHVPGKTPRLPMGGRRFMRPFNVSRIGRAQLGKLPRISRPGAPSVNLNGFDFRLRNSTVKNAAAKNATEIPVPKVTLQNGTLDAKDGQPTTSDGKKTPDCIVPKSKTWYRFVRFIVETWRAIIVPIPQDSWNDVLPPEC
ncbi:hypothetical protein HIM_05180 [Hirsutella minnesotensis 3608]|uniref:Uncharacterized protein n=1 Tax=Hirsutella minnesotensis 3608 TaxID=1043627 RepID=A0A0F8A5K4_9HYPO|nr:hypothetical protein HIM_05180 [Hirsutella minnesotensis 3608]